MDNRTTWISRGIGTELSVGADRSLCEQRDGVIQVSMVLSVTNRSDLKMAGAF